MLEKPMRRRGEMQVTTGLMVEVRVHDHVRERARERVDEWMRRLGDRQAYYRQLVQNKAPAILIARQRELIVEAACRIYGPWEEE